MRKANPLDEEILLWRLHLFVTGTEHLGKCSDLAGLPPFVGRLLKVALGPYVANYALSVEAFLQATNGPVHGLALT